MKHNLFKKVTKIDWVGVTLIHTDFYIKSDNIGHDTVKRYRKIIKIWYNIENNMNMIWIYEYIKIIWIKQNIC